MSVIVFSIPDYNLFKFGNMVTKFLLNDQT